MQALFEQVTRAADAGFFYPALIGALAIPDICGAMDAADGQADRSTYRTWFDKWVAEKYVRNGAVIFTGEDCYQLRCSFLHQGRGRSANPSYPRVFFALELKAGIVTFRGNRHRGQDPGAYFGFYPPVFCERIVAGATAWLAAASSTQLFATNYELFVRLRPGGFPGFEFGPVLY